MILPMPTPESADAWRELLSAFADFDTQFLEGPKAVRGQTAVAEGYQNLATMLALSLDMQFFADPVAPRFIDTLTPFRPDRRWGGDNTDCYYGYAVVDPRRTYRVSGRPNDSVMYSVTVYNEPEPGAWPNRTRRSGSVMPRSAATSVSVVRRGPRRSILASAASENALRASASSVGGTPRQPLRPMAEP